MVIGGNEMKYPERMAIIDNVPYEARLGYMAYCVERCLAEAHRHPDAQAQLERLPLLREGVDMLWARAERGTLPDPSRLQAIRSHLETYEKPARDSEDVDYNYDVTLVEAARMLAKGLRVLEDPAAGNSRYVAGALEGPVMIAGLINADGRAARNREVGIIDAALERLAASGGARFSRTVFDGIPDWTRGELSPRYASRKLTGTRDEDAAS